MAIIVLARAVPTPVVPCREGAAPTRLSARWSPNPVTRRLECAWVRAPGPMPAAEIVPDRPGRSPLPDAA